MLKEASSRPRAEVTRVICASVSRVAGSVMDEMFKIRNQNCKSGSAPPVRGALLYSSGWFVLWLEGQDGDVEALVRKAALDPRNSHQKLIHRSRGAASLTEPLTVVTTQGAGGSGDFGRRIYHFKEQVKQGIDHEPIAIWQQLSAPCLATHEHGRGPDRQIALVAAENNGPIELLSKLGERFGSQVVYQRFASGRSHSSDVGVAYVDMVATRRISRVQLVSRRALAHRMVRQALVGLDGLVLLLGREPSAGTNLATAVAACLQTLPARPAIYLVSASDEIAQGVGELLRKGVTNGSTPVQPMQLQQAQLSDFLLGRKLRGAVN